jgi:hypothetical protein
VEAPGDPWDSMGIFGSLGDPLGVLGAQGLPGAPRGSQELCNGTQFRKFEFSRIRSSAKSRWSPWKPLGASGDIETKSLEGPNLGKWVGRRTSVASATPFLAILRTVAAKIAAGALLRATPATFCYLGSFQCRRQTLRQTS